MADKFDQTHDGAKVDRNAVAVEMKAPAGQMFAQVMSQTRMAVSLSDPQQPDDPLVFVNRAFCELTGYEESEILGRNCRFLQGPGTSPESVAEIGRAVAAEEVIVTELLNYRKDGTAFWNALHIGPIYGEDGTLIYHFGSQWDVSNVHAARADEAHARALARELSHRMKNMFAVMNAIVGMTGRSESTAQEAATKISGRIMALGRAHEATLMGASGTEPVDLSPMLSTVLSPYDSADRIAFGGPPVRLDSNVVSMLGLALHELAINATKYGALSNDIGHVSLAWRVEDGDVDEDEILILEWRERGGPELDGTPKKVGLGGGIVTNLLSSADGSVSYDWARQGVTATITLPLPPL